MPILPFGNSSAESLFSRVELPLATQTSEQQAYSGDKADVQYRATLISIDGQSRTSKRMNEQLRWVICGGILLMIFQNVATYN